VLYFIAGSARLWSAETDSGSATPAYFISFSIVAIAITAILNVRGMSVAKWLNSAGAVARWVGTILLVGLAFASWQRFGSATPLTRQTMVPSFRIADVIFWTTLAFAWTGPEGAAFISSEIRDPKRTIAKALFFAAPMIAIVYIAGTASVLLSMTPDRATGLYGVVDAIRNAASRLGLSWLIPLGAACVALDRVGSLCLWLGALARIPVSAGIDRYLPRRFTALHPRHATPAVAIWTQAIIVCAGPRRTQSDAGSAQGRRHHSRPPRGRHGTLCHRQCSRTARAAGRMSESCLRPSSPRQEPQSAPCQRVAVAR
jgi:amino acid transporter